MKKLKLAVHLFGHLRTFDLCSSNLYRHLLDLYDCDVFIHTWSELNHSTKTWHDNDDQYGNFEVLKNESHIKELYKAKKLKIEKQGFENLGEIISVGHPISIFGIRSMIYSQLQANQLREAYEREHQKEYDFVVFTRPDILLKSHFKLEDFIANYSEEELDKSIFTAFNSKGSSYSFNDAGATDVLFFARPHVMNHFFANVSVLEKVFIDGQKYHLGPEYYFCKVFEQLGFKVVLLNYCYGTDFDILRKRTDKKGGRFITFRVKRKGVLLQILGYKSIAPLLSLRIKIGRYPIEFLIGGSN